MSFFSPFLNSFINKLRTLSESPDSPWINTTLNTEGVNLSLGGLALRHGSGNYSQKFVNISPGLFISLGSYLHFS